MHRATHTKWVKAVRISLCVLGGWAMFGVQALDINQANEAELDSFKGMGPALTAKVLQARAQAPFANWDDLAQRVSGMGAQKLKRFSQQGMTVNGQPLKP